jgi:hypothetical protein
MEIAFCPDDWLLLLPFAGCLLSLITMKAFPF